MLFLSKITGTHRGLLDDNVFDVEVFDVNVLCVGIGFSVLQQTGDELD